MTERNCTIEGCDKAYRARGLCATHYNQTHQPNRHAKVTVPCDYCGELCEKSPTSRYATRFCSERCRDLTCKGQTRQRHAMMWQGRTAHQDRQVLIASQEWRRAVHRELVRSVRSARQADIAAQMAPRPCGDCGVIYQPGTTVQILCSLRCSRRVGRRARHAREKGASGTFTWIEVMRLFLLFDRRCAYCEQPIDGQPDPEHVVPLSKGGSNSITNILPACRSCNGDKRDLPLSEWNADRARRGLPPRITSWAPEDQRVWHLTSISSAA